MKNDDWQELKSMPIEDWLDYIETDDDLGVTEVKVKSKAPTADEHLIAKFQEINEFYRRNKRLPGNNMADISELMLCKRLESIKKNETQLLALLDFDEFNLLTPDYESTSSQPLPAINTKPIESLEDIFEDDDLGLLDGSDDSIFNIRHVKKEKRAKSDFVARRKPCKDFDKYKHLFPEIHKELSSGLRKIIEFDDKGQNLRQGEFYILSGILLYLEYIEFSSEEKTVNGKRFRKDGRTRCIFENGTESNMLYRSLAKSLYADGKIVSPVGEYFSDLKKIDNQDKTSGFIYILSSKSEDPRIQSIPNLFKIGYSSTPVEKRIANATREPTYLMAPVELIASYECYNMNTQKFENLVHTVFKDVCLDIEIIDTQGKACRPREWFSVPLDQINIAIGLIASGQIINYRYNSATRKLELK